MNTPMQIIHIPRRFVLDEWGGSETFIAEVSPRLLEKGHAVQILTSKALDSKDKDTYRGIRIKRFSYFYPYFGLSSSARAMLDKKAGNLFSFALLRALMHVDKVDIIHLHTGKRLGGIARYCAMKKKVPYIISLHGGNLAVPQEEQATWVEPTKGTLEWGKILGFIVGSRRVLDDAAAIICVGKDEYDAMKQKFPGKYVEYLPNGVDVARFAKGNGSSFRIAHDLPLDRFVCLTVARLDVQKNQLGLVRQLPAIIAEVPNIHLMFIGHITSRSYVDDLKAEADALGVLDRITIIEGIPYSDQALVDAYHAADCFVLPSLHEPFGMVVLEAWASGLPVAVSKRGGLAALVTQAKDGLFFDPDAKEDSPNSIAITITKLATDATLRKTLGSEGRKTAKASYSWDSITTRLEEIYRRVHEDFIS
jgi:glycosyltransferase involved in cell wall biosynthesis